MRRTTRIHEHDLRVGRSFAGLGLFARRALRPGEYFEYTGEIISNEEADRRTKNRYLFEINSSWTIDGKERGNIARYVNHSCRPNCESVQRGTHIYIKVIAPVAAGEELTYDYGEEYVKEFIAPDGCKCAFCRSTS